MGKLATIANGLKPLIIVTKLSILNVCEVLAMLPIVLSDTIGYDTYWKGILPVVIAYKITPLK